MRPFVIVVLAVVAATVTFAPVSGGQARKPSPARKTTPAPALRITRSARPTSAPKTTRKKTAKTGGSHPPSPAPKDAQANPEAGATVAPIAIPVALFRAAGSKLKTAGGDDEPVTALMKRMPKVGPFRPFIADSCSKCALADAHLYVYGTETPTAFTFTSYFVHPPHVDRINSVSLSVDTSGDTPTVPALKDDEIKTLIGHIAFDDHFHIVVTLPASEVGLQLVGNPVDESDPDYEPILEHIFATFGIAAVRSPIDAAALRSPNDPETCPGPRRYFVYRVRLSEYPQRLLGRTEIGAHAEGFVLDCTMPDVTPGASANAAHHLPTTSTLLTNVGALGIAVAPKIFTTNVTLASSAFSKVVDVDPRSSDVRESVAAEALSNLVNNLCVRLLETRPSASPSASPSAPPSGRPSPTPQPQPSPSTSPSAIGRASPEPLQCKPRLPFRRQASGRGSEPEPFEDARSRWLGLPSPAASPRSVSP
jgi:hypothetical protein